MNHVEVCSSYLGKQKSSSHYVDEDFSVFDSVANIFSVGDAKPFDILAFNSYFICEKNIFQDQKCIVVDNGNFYALYKSSCKFVRCRILENNGIVIGKSIGDEISYGACEFYQSELVHFKNKIVYANLQCAQHFLAAVTQYIESRRAGKTVLVNKELIQVFLADVITHIQTAKQLMSTLSNQSALESFQIQSMVMQELKSGNQLLAKLQGGRAFLSGSIIEMIMIFEYFRDIYF